MNNKPLIVSIIGAVIAVVLQATVAPAMEIASALPNFILAYVLALAVSRPESGLVMPFLLGLIFDLMGTGPVGAMALICTLMAFALSRLSVVLDNDTLFMPIVLIIAGSLISNIVYGILIIACGMDVSILEALVGRALPCGIYDAVLALVMFPLLLRLMQLGENQMRMH
ncbi:MULTISPECIES: rod shape-determining protein MreD [unclassified Adlercreutzia]|uniref:rod shape-determining protein MreD n=1 Tax=unclassified Adlercreutzia TaxID=2636013 RepID=UPI0013EB37AA|nr:MULTISPECIES: rod shape-determining protein MreD [unclassified Adlercreutzia]